MMLTQTNLKVAEKTLQAASPKESLLMNLPLQIVTVRRSVLADAEALLALLSDPKVAPELHTLPYPSLDELRDRLAQSSGQGWVLVACCHDEILGLVALRLADDPRRRHAATLQWLAVSPSWQGLGIGDRLLQAVLDIADHSCNLRRLELQVFADNHRAIALYKKFGFVYEGSLQQYACRDGQYCDVDLMARLK